MSNIISNKQFIKLTPIDQSGLLDSYEKELREVENALPYQQLSNRKKDNILTYDNNPCCL